MQGLKHPSILSIREWAAWRKGVADAGGTVAVVTGTFALLHPGNLATVREAARQASDVCVLIRPDDPSMPRASVPSIAVRLEVAAHLRSVSMVAACSSYEAATALDQLRPFTLVDCLKQKEAGAIATAAVATHARKLADRVVDLAPVPGCFTADIQKAIQKGHTPIAIPEDNMLPQPTDQDLDRFLNAGAKGRLLITVNGCFDVLHLGHMRLLERARNLGARLLVLVNDDGSVRRYKGVKRPIFPIRFRLHALSALDPVDLAYPFSGDNPLSLLAKIRPDIHVKGGSFEEARVSDERRLVESWGGRLAIIPLVEGFSTTNVISRMAGKNAVSGK